MFQHWIKLFLSEEVQTTSFETSPIFFEYYSLTAFPQDILTKRKTAKYAGCKIGVAFL
jgi:hypothetical protein